MSQYGPVVLSIVGGLFVLIVGAWSLLQQVARDREIAGLQRQLAAKSDEIASLTRDSLAAVTGGESFVYLQPLRKQGRVTYFIRQTGSHPTFDVVVRVQDGTGQRVLFGPATIGTIKCGSGMDWTRPLPP